MNWYKIASNNYIEMLESKYPKTNGTIDNLNIRGEVPNTSSISASLNNWYELPGIRNIPMSEFNLTGKSYSVEENNRIQQLQEQIKASQEINPLIVVADKEGLYILEGGHRADALYNLGAKSLPAIIVVDTEDMEHNENL